MNELQRFQFALSRYDQLSVQALQGLRDVGHVGFEVDRFDDAQILRLFSVERPVDR